MYNINRVGENVTSIEEYDVASINATTYAVSGLTLVGTMHYSFDSNGKQFRKKYVDADGNEQKYVFEYQDEQNVAVQLPTGVVSHSKSDHLGRKVFDELQLGKGLMNRKFTYHEGKITDAHEANDKKVSDPQTTLVKQIEFADGRTIEYTYDNEERITKVVDSVDGTYEYTYDALGQLLTETVNDVVVNTMTYDQYGNIKTKNGKTYTYDATWKDKLTKVGSQTITYDANGNPTNYLGAAATWEKGRQLKAFGTNSYKYNNDGIRIKKTTSTEIHEYILDGTNIVKEIVTDICNCPKYTNEYLYDLDGTVCGLKHNGVAYYFYKNLQGDVIAITNDAGVVVARYTYDAWGVPTITQDISDCQIATVNPFRYRSYYYDAETNLYYLQSRYYDPVVGRFINADTIFDFKHMNNLGSNLMCYCKNNPCNYLDFNGHWVVGLSFETQIACGVGVYVVYNIFFDQNYFLISWGLGGQIQFNMSFGVSATFLWYPWMDSVDNTVGFSASTSLGVSIYGVYAGGGVAIDWASLNAGFSFSAGYMPSLFPVTYRVNVGWCWKIVKLSYKQFERLIVGAYKVIRILGKTIIEIRKATKNYLVFNLRGTNYRLKYWLKERRFVLDS